jgi:hypothetical protein
MKPDAGEMRAALCALGLALAFMASVLATGVVPLGQFAALLRVYAQSLAALAFVVGSIALFVACGLRARAEGVLPSPFGFIRDWLTLRWQRDRLLSVLTPPVVCMIVLASFNSFKQLVLPAAGFGLDPLFAELDRALFLGHDPWILTHRLLGSVDATKLVDSFYHGWFVPMTLGITVAAFIASSELRMQYVLSYAVMWIVIGCLLAWLLPSAGPCYYQHFHGLSAFDPLMARLDAIDAALAAGGEGGLSALRNQAALLSHFDSGSLALGGGISAMPSMHNAMSVLFALGGMRLNRALGWAMWAYAVLIWVGSVHLGWHYALDGIVAAAVTLAIWWACGALVRTLLAAPRPALPALAE